MPTANYKIFYYSKKPNVHPVVENLMEASGMPHVHENDEHEDKATQEKRQ